MALQTSGKISLGDIRDEFGGSNPVRLSDYYRGGGIVPDVPSNSGVPTSGTIKITDLYGATSYVPVQFNPSSINFNGAGQTLSVTITSSEPWDLVYPLWVSASSNSGSGGVQTVSLTVGANPDGTTRNTIIFANTTEDSATLNLSQSGNPDTLTLTPSTKYIGDGNADTYNISVGTNSFYTVTSNQPWISTSILNGVRVQVFQNNSGSVRYGAVEVTTANNRIETHTITQENYVATTSYKHNVIKNTSQVNACSPFGTFTDVYSTQPNFSISNKLYTNSTLSNAASGFFLKDGIYLETDSNGNVIDQDICSTGGGGLLV
jgi:hypothetical protein